MMRWKKNIRNDGDEQQIDLPSITINSQTRDSGPQSINNELYFYSEVSESTVYVLNRSIDELVKHLKTVQIIYNMSEPPPIHLHISSAGGEVFAGISAMDKIESCPIPIYTYIEGLCASSATLMSVVGKKRYITKNSCMLIHQLSSAIWGSFSQILEENKNLSLLMEILKKVYLQKTKFTEKNLNELLQHDLYIESKECKKIGLVDFIC